VPVATAAGSNPGALERQGRFARYDLRWVILAGLAITKLLLVWGRSPLYTGDEGLWERIGRISLFDVRFWTAGRPFTVPLVHKLLGFSDERVVWFQAIFGAVAWTTLAFAVSRLVRPKLGSELAFGLVLALGLTTGVHGWDFVIRSESISNSCLVLLFASTLNALDCVWSRDWKKAWLWSGSAAVSGVFGSFARDSNAYVLGVLALFVASAALLVAARTERGRRLRSFGCWLLLSTALVLGFTGFVARKNAELSERFRFPLINVIFIRVLPSPARRTYFEKELYMPVSRALLGRKNKQVSADNWYVQRAPELELFRRWLKREGYRSYQRYLLAHPRQTLRDALRLVPQHAAQTHFGYTRRGVNPVSSSLDRILIGGFSLLPWAFSALATLAAGLGLYLGDRGLRLLSGFTLFALLCMLTQAYVGFHGDAFEVSRHCLNVGLCFWLGMASGLLVIALLIVRFVERQRAQKDTAGGLAGSERASARPA
jgi:hypothetical protein